MSLVGAVTLDEVPAFPDLEQILSILPDTLELEARGSIVPIEGSGPAFLVDRMQAAGIPLPRRVVPDVLEALGREALPGLPAEALSLQLPAGLDDVEVSGDVVLVRSGG